MSKKITPTDLIIHYANDMLQMWSNLIKDANASENPSWYKYEVRQAYQDSLNGLVANGLIETYDVVDIRVKLDGVWRSDRRNLTFVER